MKVTIERLTERRGIVFKKEVHVIWLAIEFNEEEKFAINKMGVKDQIFYTAPHPWDDAPDYLREKTVKDLFRKRWAIATCKTLVEANAEEQKIRDALKNLKALIDEHKAAPKAKDSFEL